MRFVKRQRTGGASSISDDVHPTADEQVDVGAGAPSRLTTTVVRGAGLTGAGVLMTQVITIASYAVLARLAGPAVFGAFAAAWTLVGFSTIFVESGMSAALIQRKDRLDEAAATAFVSTFAAGLGLSALALVLSPVLGLYFDSREIGVIAASLSGILFLNAASVVPNALLRRRFSVVQFGVIDPINALVYGAVAAVTLAVGLGVWGLVIATYAGTILRASAAWLLAAWLPDLRAASFAMWRELARYARSIVASEFLNTVSLIANTLLVGRFLGLAPLGAYRFGWRMAMQAAVLFGSAAYPLFPAFARIADEPDRFRASFLRAIRLMAVLVIPAGVALIPLAEQIAVVLLGERWRSTGHVLAALAGVAVSLPLLTLAAEVFKAANRPDLVARVSLFLTVGSVAFMAACLPFGVAGVAGGVSLAYAIAAVVALRDVGRVLVLPLRRIVAELVRPALASVGMLLVLTPFVDFVARVNNEPTHNRLAWLAAEILFAVVSYGGILAVIAPSAVAELKLASRTLVRSVSGAR
jgi:O-antigen/teichoic acid export membrane protein